MSNSYGFEIRAASHAEAKSLVGDRLTAVAGCCNAGAALAAASAIIDGIPEPDAAHDVLVVVSGVARIEEMIRADRQATEECHEESVGVSVYLVPKLEVVVPDPQPPVDPVKALRVSNAFPESPTIDVFVPPAAPVVEAAPVQQAAVVDEHDPGADADTIGH